ncbi:hypothetical protein Taro_017422, partial [Colocasia esculenta]|nr:hypothetical protein [Colocasia esculenta]
MPEMHLRPQTDEATGLR